MSTAEASRERRAALVVIDVQESFRHMPYWSDVDLPSFRAALLRLEAGCRQRGVPVVHVFHVEPSGPFSTASGHVRALSTGCRDRPTRASSSTRTTRSPIPASICTCVACASIAC
jgi:nicotinamidase-related amidase